MTSPGPVTDGAVLPARARRRRRVSPRPVALLVAVVVVAGGSTAATLSRGSTADAVPVRAEQPVAVPVVQVVGTSRNGRVPWSKPLRVMATSGSLASVTVVDSDGREVEGTLAADGVWRSAATLLPLATYSVTAVAQDAKGAPHPAPLLQVRATPAEKLLHARVSPGDGAVVGVGLPVVVSLDRPVPTKAARRLVEQRLALRTSPAVEGAWRWMSDREVHYRGATFWKPGTRITVSADLRRLQLPGGTWGAGRRTSTFTVGAAMVSTVDVRKYTMTVTRGGRVLRVLKASMGKPGYDTRGGTHIVLEKFRHKIMDAATLGTPRSSADYYRTAVEHAVRITNSGTFTHGAPWSVKDQGRRNVSHGCINLSPADARWFYGLAKRGDVVRVVGASVGPRLWDAGSSEWNLSFAQWKAGSALA